MLVEGLCQGVVCVRRGFPAQTLTKRKGIDCDIKVTYTSTTAILHSIHCHITIYLGNNLLFVKDHIIHSEQR